MNSILIITPEEKTVSSLGAALKNAGYYLDYAFSTDAALELAREKKPNAVLFAFWDMPTQPIKEFVSALKQTASVVFLGLVTPSQLKDYDYTTGIDDFVVFPYNPVEVLTRLKQLLWQHKGLDDHQTLKVGDLVIDPTKYEVSVGGRRIDLTYKEYELLLYLASNSGKVLTRETLLNQVWGYDYFGGTRTVDVHIRRLRSKIEDANHVFVDTVRNVGYRFRE